MLQSLPKTALRKSAQKTLTESPLTIVRASALYIGAILGPGLLLIPGLAASIAGPASMVSLGAILVLSALLAILFGALGIKVPSADGARGYIAAGLGTRMGTAAAWSFLLAVVVGAPTICLIGAEYVSGLFGGGTPAAAAIAAGILATVLVVTLAGVRASTTVQLVLVALIVVIVALSVFGPAHAAKAANWTPFAPGGLTSIGHAAAVLMFSFCGWEAAAPLIARFRRPRRQLPWTIAIAFVATSGLTVALLAVTIGVLGRNTGGAPLSELLEIAIGPAGAIVGAVVAVVLTLGTINTYLAGANEMFRAVLSASSVRVSPRLLLVAIGASGIVILGLVSLGVVTTTELITIPTTLFLTIYLGSAVSAVRIFRGPVRLVAILTLLALAPVLASCGWALLVPAVLIPLVALAGILATRKAKRAAPTKSPDLEVCEVA